MQPAFAQVQPIAEPPSGEVTADDLRTPAPIPAKAPPASEIIALPPLSEHDENSAICSLQSPHREVRSASADLLIARGGAGVVQKLESILLVSKESPTPLPRRARRALANVLTVLSHKDVATLHEDSLLLLRRMSAISHGAPVRAAPVPKQLY